MVQEVVFYVMGWPNELSVRLPFANQALGTHYKSRVKTGWLNVMAKNETEWNIRLWCWRAGLLVGQHYKFSMSVVVDALFVFWLLRYICLLFLYSISVISGW